MRRAMDCQCGHHVEARDDEELYEKVKQHVDDEHHDLRLTNEQIRELIRTKAYDLA